MSVLPLLFLLSPSLSEFSLFFFASHRPWLGLKGVKGPKRRWSLQLFQTRSVKHTAWLAPLREEALQTYIKINQAQSRFVPSSLPSIRPVIEELLSSGDYRTIDTLTHGKFNEEVRKRVKSMPSANDKLLVWKYHGEASPTQCLSIRTFDDDVFYGTQTKKNGNGKKRGGKRLMAAQVLMKLDTLQVRQDVREFRPVC